MSPPTVRVNTLVMDKMKPYIDSVSQMFVILEVMFGLDRIPLIKKDKPIFAFLTFMISIIFNGTVIYFMVISSYIYPLRMMPIATIITNIIITLLSFLRCKWMKRFYTELNKFDMEAGCRPNVPKSCIWNAVQAAFMWIFIVLLFEIPLAIGFLSYVPHHLMPLHLVYVLEVFYMGHLLNLLTPRLKLLNYYIESSLSSTKPELSSVENEFVYMKFYDENLPQCQMRKLMDLYEVVVEAYDFLVEGIKWQFFIVIISAFVTVLGFLYVYALKAIETSQIITDGAIMELGVSLVMMVPLFAPCVASGHVHNEVRKLRELLASRLYENKLDKTGRRVARALIAFTETRDLSFRLLRIIDIDVSLPFKFVGLLVTYLIILLQFERVINA